MIIMNKQEIFIHIGLPKTGTTFLQEEIFPKLNNVNFILRDFSLAQYSEGKNLISNERITGGITGDADYKTILDRIKKLFPNIKIIVVFRNKDEWIRSCYYQFIGTSENRLLVKSFKEYYDNYFNKSLLDFVSFEQYLKDMFDDVLVLDYNLLKTDSNRFIEMICGFIGVDIPVYDNNKYNISLKDKHYKLLRLADKVDGIFRHLN